MVETVKELMDVDTFLGIYCIGRDKYFKEVNKGNLKVTRQGRRTYIKRIDAEDWLAKFGD